jgi:hypothetical protein
VGDQVILDFVKVLDQRLLRTDEGESEGEAADRGTWEARVGQLMMQVCDRVLELANEVANPPLELKYMKRHVGICEHGSFFNVVVLYPKKSFVACRLLLSNAVERVEKADKAGLDARIRKGNLAIFNLRNQDFNDQSELLRDVIQQAVRESQA